MLANRFAKLLPMASKVFVARTPLMAVTMARPFSSVEMVSRSGAKLAKALEKEIKYENENYTQVEDIETFLRESGFTYSEDENGVHMKLTKTLGKHTVEIQFEAR
jgi:hypothetical protein